MDNWLDVVGSGRSFTSGGLSYIYQYRNGAFVKAVTVIVWDNPNGKHGRYYQNWGAGNWQAGDVLYFSQADIPISIPSVSVYLDGTLVSSAAGSTMAKEVVFAYTDGALLEIKEDPAAIIKINSFTSGSSCVACEAGKFKATAGNGAESSVCAACDAHSADCAAQPSPRISPGTCDAGFYGVVADNALTCAACSAGKFKATAGNGAESSVCTPCANGYTTVDGTATGVTTQSECTSCAAGYFGASVGGTSSCSACAIGKYSLVDAATCTDCKAGYSTERSATGIKHPCRCCAGGYYGSSVVGIDGCTICVQGKYSEPGNWKKCIQCPVGRYTVSMGTPGYDASACAICRSEYEAKIIDGASVCVPCPVGKHANAGQVCTGCERGRYMVLTYRSRCHFTQVCDAARSCPYCPAGKYGPQPNATSCRECVAGKHMDRTGAQTGCDKCPVGTYSAPGAVTCMQCPAGTSSARDASQCSMCAAGKYAAMKASSECTKCTAGTISAVGAGTCSNCPAGRYSNAAASACIACPAGRYSGAARSAECMFCPAHTYSAADASGCASCAFGQFSAPGSAECEGEL